MFCGTKNDLSDEHVFPAFMGGELVVRYGSCKSCNHEFSQDEAHIKDATNPLLNLLGIENRYGKVPNAPLDAEIRGLDLEHLPAFMDGMGEIQLLDVVRESTAEDGRKLRQGFFITERGAEQFAARARQQGREVIEREVPREIVVDANYTVTVHFIASPEARRVAAKIALTAMGFTYGTDFVLSPMFNELRRVRDAKSAADLPIRFFANGGIMKAFTHTPHQHSVICYLSAGMHKGWALVTLFGGVSYLVWLTNEYYERESRQFSLFYDAEEKKRINPVVLADEMTLIGHVLSPATKFEDPSAVHEQWSPILMQFCDKKGVTVEPIRNAAS